MATTTITLARNRIFQGRLPGLILLICLVVTGIFICGDYGISWDEPTQRYIGDVNLQYVRSRDARLLENFSDRDHGAAFELPLKWIEEVISPKNERGVFFLRHLCSFLFYMAGVWCAYLLGRRLFRRQWLALLGMVMLVLSPRIFAHAFFNSKDVPFLSAMLIVLYTITVALEGGKAWQYLLAGAACGFATGIRTMGVLPAMLICLLIFSGIFSDARQWKVVLRNLLLFISGTVCILYLSWPALWHHPVQSFLDSYHNLAQFKRWRNVLLFDGIVYPGTQLPPGYIPVWFCISTPICWLVLGVAGCIQVILHSIRRRAFIKTAKGKLLLLCAALFTLPIVSVIALHSVLYDDWRHLYFIYAPFVVLALYGAEQLGRLRYGRPLLALFSGLQIVAVIVFMIGAHPFEQVYFNSFVPHREEYLRRHFDYEYWGTSYRQGLGYILAHDGRDTIPVVSAGAPMENNLSMLNAKDRGRIKLLSDPAPGAYFMTIFRWHPGDYPFTKVWGIKVGGSTVMQVYRVGE